jgi:murein endopeptidase
MAGLVAAAVALAAREQPGGAKRASSAAVIAPGADGPAVPRPLASTGPLPKHSTPTRGPSRAVGIPGDGRLEGGVLLPAEGPGYVTWDYVLKRAPNRAWRRYGTRRLVKLVREVVARYAQANPRAAPVGIGDLSLPRGGKFGRRYGGIGHSSHQNGLDVDVHYPRADGEEREPNGPGEVDRLLAQQLVDRFVRAGAQYVYVDPRLKLRGPRSVVIPLSHHEDHMHVRVRSSTPEAPRPPAVLERAG